MRIILVNETGVHFHSDVLKEEPLEYYCSCTKNKSHRNIQLKSDNVVITLPDKEYVAVILRKVGKNDKPLYQHHLDGVSIFTTKKYMVMARFATSYQAALRHLQDTNSLPPEEDKYIVSTKKIDKIQTARSQDDNKIFVYESSFGDVFSGVQENYTGEQTSADQQMYTRLKKSSYSTLFGSYPVCWT